jgi:hypothetical protein
MALLDVIRRGRKDPRVLQRLVHVAPTPEAAESLADFINERPALRKQFLELSEGAHFSYSDNTMARLEVSGLLQSYAMHVAENGDLRSAIGGASGAWMLVKEDVNPLAVKAEIYLALQDRIAARYAKKVLKFKPPKGRGLIETALAAPENIAAFAEVKARMTVVVRECEAHPEWRDSYPSAGRHPAVVEELL